MATIERMTARQMSATTGELIGQGLILFAFTFSGEPILAENPLDTWLDFLAGQLYYGLWRPEDRPGGEDVGITTSSKFHAPIIFASAELDDDDDRIAELARHCHRLIIVGD